MKVELTERAERDLVVIGNYIATDNPLRADDFVDELLDRCASLTEFPKRYPLANRYSDVRRCRHGTYLIFYRIEPDVIRILHILHGATDYGPLLEGL